MFTRNYFIEFHKTFKDITMFDLAEVYGPYTNEESVGDALIGKRNNVQIATNGDINFF